MKQVGTLTPQIAALVGIQLSEAVPILIGLSNITHMQSRHPRDYARYGVDIPVILSHPDYVGRNVSDGSIEFVKEYLINGEYVKVAVRVSASGTYFARSLYVLNRNRVQNFIAKGTLKKVT